MTYVLGLIIHRYYKFYKFYEIIFTNKKVFMKSIGRYIATSYLECTKIQQSARSNTCRLTRLHAINFE